MNKNDFLIEKLGAHHNRELFSCGVESLDVYFKRQIKQDARKRIAAPFILVDRTCNRVAGYYTLSSIGINLSELPPEITKKLPKYPILPGTMLGRLAVEQSYRGKKLGEMLLMDALYRSLTNEIASMAVVVEAKDSAARTFYEHYDFICFPTSQTRLFLTMRTIEQMFK